MHTSKSIIIKNSNFPCHEALLSDDANTHIMFTIMHEVPMHELLLTSYDFRYCLLSIQLFDMTRPSESSIVGSLALVWPCLELFPLLCLRSFLPYFIIPLYSDSCVCFFLLFHPYSSQLGILCEIYTSCMGSPFPILSTVNGLLYFGHLQRLRSDQRLLLPSYIIIVTILYKYIFDLQIIKLIPICLLQLTI